MVEDYRHRPIDTSSASYSFRATYEELKSGFDSLDPDRISQACKAWADVATTLGNAATELRTQFGEKLKDYWEAESSAEAQKQLQTAQATASALAEQCMMMARANDYAANYARWYKDHFPRDVGPSGVGEEGTKNAGDHTEKYLNRLNEVITNTLPSEVAAKYQTVDPLVGGSGDFSRDADGPGSIDGPGDVSVGSVGTHTPGVSGHQISPFGDVSGHGPIAGDWSGVDDGQLGSSLGDWDPGTDTAGAGGIGGGAGLGAGLAGGGAGPGSGGAGPGSGGAGLSGAGTGFGGALAGGLGTGAAGRGAGGAAGRRGAGGGAGAGNRGPMPMSGAGPGGADETEEERSTWLTEDEDVWDGESTAPPPVIGG